MKVGDNSEYTEEPVDEQSAEGWAKAKIAGKLGMTRALKMPAPARWLRSWPRLPGRRAGNYLEFLTKVLSEEVASREAHGGG